MFPPKNLKCISDQNVLEYRGSTPVTKAQKEIFYTYKYIKSETKKGSLINFPETELKILIANNILKEITEND
jgi:hypothetical protein